MVNIERKVPLTSEPKLFYGWYMVVAVWIMRFLSSAVTVSIFFKPMLEDFGWGRATLALVQSVAMIVFIIASPIIGRLIDQFGPRLMILVAVPTQVFSRLINGIATNIWHLYLARLAFGINVTGSSQVLINRWFVKKRGAALGIAATGMPIGLIILIPISQHLILTWGWRPTMLFWAAVTFVMMLPLALIIKNSPEDKGYRPNGEPLDVVGPIDPSLYRREVIGEVKLSGKTGIDFFKATKTRDFWLLGTTQLICGVGCGFMMTHIVIFATDMGYSDMVAASLVSVQGGLNLLGVLVTGYLSDMMARKNVLALTHFVRCISFAAIVAYMLFNCSSPWILYSAVALFGFGWFTTAPLTSGLVADLFGRLRMGTIHGVTLACHMFGGAIGAYAGGAIFDLTKSYYLIILIQTILEFIATFFAFSIKQKRYG